MGDEEDIMTCGRLERHQWIKKRMNKVHFKRVNKIWDKKRLSLPHCASCIVHRAVAGNELLLVCYRYLEHIYTNDQEETRQILAELTR